MDARHSELSVQYCAQSVVALYDYNRPHQGLGNQTPWEVYRPKRQKRLAGAI